MIQQRATQLSALPFAKPSALYYLMNTEVVLEGVGLGGVGCAFLHAPSIAIRATATARHLSAFICSTVIAVDVNLCKYKDFSQNYTV